MENDRAVFQTLHINIYKTRIKISKKMKILDVSKQRMKRFYIKMFVPLPTDLQEMEQKQIYLQNPRAKQPVSQKYSVRTAG